jgi:hypothetical protein
MPTPPTTGRSSTRKKWIDPFKLHEDASSLQSASGALHFQLQNPASVYKDNTPEPEEGDNDADAEHALPTPARTRTVRTKEAPQLSLTPIVEEEVDEATSSQSKTTSPFDSWARTKSARKTQSKREGDVLLNDKTKRVTRSTPSAA